MSRKFTIFVMPMTGKKNSSFVDSDPEEHDEVKGKGKGPDAPSAAVKSEGEDTGGAGPSSAGAVGAREFWKSLSSGSPGGSGGGYDKDAGRSSTGSRTVTIGRSHSRAGRRWTAGGLQIDPPGKRIRAVTRVWRPSGR